VIWLHTRPFAVAVFVLLISKPEPSLPSAIRGKHGAGLVYFTVADSVLLFVDQQARACQGQTQSNKPEPGLPL